jgi:hypothetical protein
MTTALSKIRCVPSAMFERKHISLLIAEILGPLNERPGIGMPGLKRCNADWANALLRRGYGCRLAKVVANALKALARESTQADLHCFRRLPKRR